jgi:hypothetical protein
MDKLLTPPAPADTADHDHDLTEAPPQRLLGEVITWAGPGTPVRHADLTSALTAAGLDPALARELAPRHAFTRACRALARERVIRPASEDVHTVTFQFTRESRRGGRFEYDLEAMLALDKRSGVVTCGDANLAAVAQAELDRCVAARTGADVTRVVQRLFERHADLFPIREQGGAYFVPAEHRPFVGRVAAFLAEVGGRVARFPVPAGTPGGDRSVTEAVASGLSALVGEFRRAVAGFDADTRPGTFERAAARVRAAKLKVEAYAEYLAGEKARLDAEVAAAVRELREKAAAVPVGAA